MKLSASVYVWRSVNENAWSGNVWSGEEIVVADLKMSGSLSEKSFMMVMGGE